MPRAGCYILPVEVRDPGSAGSRASALVFYNALLPGVAAGRGAGKISGCGTAAGYVGTILALVVLTPLVSEA